MAFDYRTAESLILKIVNSSNTFKEFDALVKLHKPNFQWESKATDADGDLVTMTVFGNTIEYIRRTHPDDVDGKDDGVFHYVITKLNSWVRAENKFKPVSFWKQVARNLIWIRK